MGKRPVSARRRRVSYPTAENDALSQGLAMVAVPALLGLLGAWLDSKAGTGPILLIGFALFGLAGAFVSAYYRYEDRIRRHEAGKPWNRADGGAVDLGETT
jgi:F0F1-type ATP synthase assembly protein I